MKKKIVLTSTVLLTLFLSTILPIASTVAIAENNPLGHSVESGRHLISVWNYTTNPSGGIDIAEAVAVDSDNNIIVVGYDRAISASDLQWRIMKFNSTGSQLWENVTNPSGRTDIANDVAVDSEDNIIVVGHDNVPDNPEWRIVKFNSAGDFLWENVTNPSGGIDVAKGVAVDSEDNIIVVGYDEEPGDFQWRIMKFSSASSLLWENVQNPSNHTDNPRNVAVDSNDNIIVAGHDYNNTLQQAQWRTIKYDSSGYKLWEKITDPSDDADYSNAVAVDSEDNIIVVGYDKTPGDSQWRIMKFAEAHVCNINTGLWYLTIQEAIDAPETLDGHTIFVEEGTYYENVVVGKSISLIGENRSTTIIDGDNQWSVINVTSSNVNISNFTVRNSLNIGIAVFPHTANNTIWGNKITSNHWNGIVLDYSSNNNTVCSNYIENNGGYGILLLYSYNNTVSENNITDNLYGISLYYSDYNTVSGNTVTLNNLGIYLSNSANNIINTNQVIQNIRKGYVANGIMVSYSLSENNRITNNTVTYNEDCGIVINQANWNTIDNNTITSNGDFGIRMDYANWNSVQDNVVWFNPKGIAIIQSSNNIIRGNIASDSILGIFLWVSSNNNTLTHNTVCDNTVGMKLEDSANNNVIYHNNFINNIDQVCLYGSYDNVWDYGYPSGGNYWSDYAGVDLFGGVYQNETGRDGIGDTPYFIDANNTDYYPFINPWGPVHNINTTLNYWAIQEAINANETLAGHTIFVEAGTYYENVVVNKSITLVGENKSNTVVDGRNLGNTIWVTVDDVVIRGFKVTNSSSQNSGIFLQGVENTIITDNNVSGNGFGVLVMWGSYNSILNNFVTHNAQPGIRIDGTDSPARVANNTVEYNEPDGIFLYAASNVLIENNTISKNKQTGIAPLGGCMNITIGNNLIADNGWRGIYFLGTNSSIIEGNVIIRNGYGGPFDWIPAGINLYVCSSNVVVGNDLIENNVYGITVASSVNNKIYHNSFYNNVHQAGIFSTPQSPSINNVWDDSYPSGGNYWSDYSSVDVYSGPYQNETDYDWIGDIPYLIDENNQDNYPLMYPFVQEMEEIRIAYRSLLIKYAEIRSDLDALNSTCIDLQEQIDDLQEQVDLLDSTLQERIDSLNSTCIDLQESIDDLIIMLNSTRDNLQEQIESLNSTFQTSIDDLQEQVNSLNSTFQTSFDELQELYDSLNSTFQTSMDNLQEQIDSLNSTQTSNKEAIINELSTLRNLMYVFITAIVILIATTVYFARRKPKMNP